MRSLQSVFFLLMLAVVWCAASFADDSTTLQLQCRLVNSANKPIPAAIVRLREIPEQPASVRESILARAAGLFGRKPDVKKLASTDAQGIAATGNLKPGVYVLEFQLEGHLPAVSHRSHARAVDINLKLFFGKDEKKKRV